MQGASFPDLREQSAQDMAALGFEGFAIGGVAVGEPHEEMMKAVEAVNSAFAGKFAQTFARRGHAV